MTDQRCPVSPQRPDGWYWVRENPTSSWSVGHYRFTSNPNYPWRIVGDEGGYRSLAEIGPRIPSPDEQQTAERDKHHPECDSALYGHMCDCGGEAMVAERDKLNAIVTIIERLEDPKIERGERSVHDWLAQILQVLVTERDNNALELRILKAERDKRGEADQQDREADTFGNRPWEFRDAERGEPS